MQLEKLKRELNKPTEPVEGEGLYFPNVELGTIEGDYDNTDYKGLDFSNGTFSTDYTRDLDRQLENLYEENKKLNLTKTPSNYNEAMGYAQSYRQVRGFDNIQLAEKESSYMNKIEQLNEKLSNTKNEKEIESINKEIERINEDILDIRALRAGIYNQINLREDLRGKISNLEDRKKAVLGKLSKYNEQYSHLASNPVKAIEIGLALDRERSLESTRGNVVQFGEDAKSHEYIIDSALNSARVATHTGIYEVDDKGNIGSELSRKELPEKGEDLILLSTNEGFMYSDKEGNKYLIKSDQNFKRIADESKAIHNYLTDFSKSNVDNAIHVEGNIYKDGRIYDENYLAKVLLETGAGKSISKGTKAVTVKQPDGDLVNIVVYDADTANPKVVYSSINDLVNGGIGKSRSTERYRTYRAGFLREDMVNRKSSSSLPNNQQYIIN